MSDYVKSISDAERITNGLLELKEEMNAQKQATQVNNRELQKLNQVAQLVQEEKIIKLEQEITKMKADAKWVHSEAPAIDYKPDHLMKKLNVL